jgi:hypothetical protein
MHRFYIKFKANLTPVEERRQRRHWQQRRQLKRRQRQQGQRVNADFGGRSCSAKATPGQALPPYSDAGGAGADGDDIVNNAGN